ncbi:MAG: hypothetical protein LBN21_02725 [Treponema sp.]|jgi:hypothetical protein|nr:hypothetical protein [Treponema sp.]
MKNLCGLVLCILLFTACEGISEWEFDERISGADVGKDAPDLSYTVSGTGLTRTVNLSWTGSFSYFSVYKNGSVMYGSGYDASSTYDKKSYTVYQETSYKAENVSSGTTFYVKGVERSEKKDENKNITGYGYSAKEKSKTITVTF